MIRKDFFQGIGFLLLIVFVYLAVLTQVDAHPKSFCEVVGNVVNPSYAWEHLPFSNQGGELTSAELTALFKDAAAKELTLYAQKTAFAKSIGKMITLPVVVSEVTPCICGCGIGYEALVTSWTAAGEAVIFRADPTSVQQMVKGSRLTVRGKIDELKPPTIFLNNSTVTNITAPEVSK